MEFVIKPKPAQTGLYLKRTSSLPVYAFINEPRDEVINLREYAFIDEPVQTGNYRSREQIYRRNIKKLKKTQKRQLRNINYFCGISYGGAISPSVGDESTCDLIQNVDKLLEESENTLIKYYKTKIKPVQTGFQVPRDEQVIFSEYAFIDEPVQTGFINYENILPPPYDGEVNDENKLPLQYRIPYCDPPRYRQKHKIKNIRMQKFRTKYYLPCYGEIVDLHIPTHINKSTKYYRSNADYGGKDSLLGIINHNLIQH